MDNMLHQSNVTEPPQRLSWSPVPVSCRRREDLQMPWHVYVQNGSRLHAVTLGRCGEAVAIIDQNGHLSEAVRCSMATGSIVVNY